MQGIQWRCFQTCFLTNFDNSGQIEISCHHYREVSIITRNTLGLDAIIVLLRDRNSTVLNILVYKLHCKFMG